MSVDLRHDSRMFGPIVALVFSRSVRSIETDGYRRSWIVFGIALAMAAAWTAWFTLARVAVVEVAETARLEVDRAAHAIDAPVGGEVTMTRVVLGQQVTAGEVLVELDTEPLRLAVGLENAQQAAVAPQAAALTEEIEASERALDEQRRVAGVRIEESRIGQRQAESALEFAERELARTQRLEAEGLAPAVDLSRARAEVEQKRSLLEGARMTPTRIEAELRAAETERRAAIATRRKELAQLDGQRATSAARLEQLAHELARRQIRAPVAGRIGEVEPVRVGGVVEAGARLGAIIPTGSTHIVAELSPAAAIGRVHPGQAAWMRPDGFPWTQYGMIPATVRRVANEPRSGRIRVELDVNLPGESPIPLQHGLPGTLEIEIERVAPVTLVLRAAGRRLAAPATPRSDGGDQRP